MILSADEVCELIDNYPDIRSVVAAEMKELVRKGECPFALRNSLGLERVTMFRRDESLMSEKERNRLAAIPLPGDEPHD